MLYKNDGRVPCRLKSASGKIWVLRPTQSIEIDEDIAAPAFISKIEKKIAKKSVEPRKSKSVWKKKKSSPDEDDPKTTKE